jgi:hypothetical protein
MSNTEETLERIGCTDPKINGSGTVSAVAAVYLASRFGARPVDGLLSAAFLRKADTDTLAPLTDALPGAPHGTRWLGTWPLTCRTAVTSAHSPSAARPAWPIRRRGRPGRRARAGPARPEGVGICAVFRTAQICA